MRGSIDFGWNFGLGLSFFFLFSIPAPVWFRRDFDLCEDFYDYFYGYLFSTCGDDDDNKPPLSPDFDMFFPIGLDPPLGFFSFALSDPTISTLDGHLSHHKNTRIVPFIVDLEGGSAGQDSSMHMRKKKKAKGWDGGSCVVLRCVATVICMYIEFLGALNLPMKSSLHFT